MEYNSRAKINTETLQFVNNLLVTQEFILQSFID